MEAGVIFKQWGIFYAKRLGISIAGLVENAMIFSSRTLVSLLILLLAFFPSCTQAADGLAAASKVKAIKIILVGDSTTSQVTGWGGAFCSLHVTGMTGCLALGRGGRSTKTYRNEGSWDLALNEIRTPGYESRYVLIEFGHNDKNADPEIGTSLANGEFAENLARFVDDVRRAGGVPVLVTPLAARHFQNGQLNDSLVEWAKAVRSVAVRTRAPLIDLNQSSSILFRRIGAVAALAFEGQQPTEPEVEAARRGTTLSARIPALLPGEDTPTANDPRRSYKADYIHLNRGGAEQISTLVADGLLKVAPSLKGYVIP